MERHANLNNHKTKLNFKNKERHLTLSCLHTQCCHLSNTTLRYFHRRWDATRLLRMLACVSVTPRHHFCDHSYCFCEHDVQHIIILLSDCEHDAQHIIILLLDCERDALHMHISFVCFHQRNLKSINKRYLKWTKVYRNIPFQYMSLLTGRFEMLWIRRPCLWLLNFILCLILWPWYAPHLERRWHHNNLACFIRVADNTPLVCGRHVREARVKIRVPEKNIDAVDVISEPPSRGISVIIVRDRLGRSDRVYFQLGVNQTSVLLELIRKIICCEQRGFILYVYMTPK